MVNFNNPLAQSTNVSAQSIWRKKMPFHFTNKLHPTLYKCIELEDTPNFYTLCSAPYASKFNVNLLVQKLIIKWWWNWPQMKKVRRMSRQWRKGIINCFIDTREKGSRLNHICFWQGLNVVLKNVRGKNTDSKIV